MSEKVARTCHLKKVVITLSKDTGERVKTLREYLDDVFEKYPNASNRKLQLDEDSDTFRVMNDWKFIGDGNSRICLASIFSYTLYANQNAVVLRDDKPSYPIEMLAPDRSPKHYQEFIEGLAWFATTGDYIAVMAAQTVSFSAIEDYLGWILSSLIGTYTHVQFVEPYHMRLKDCDMTNAKKLVIHGGIDVSEVEGNDGGGHAFSASGNGWSVVSAIFGAFNIAPPKFKFLGPDALDQVDVKVVISTHRTKSSPAMIHDAVSQFANAFKDVENPPVDIEFSDGRRLSLSEYRIKKAFQVESRNKIPIVEDVCTILVSWLRQQIGLQNLATF